MNTIGATSAVAAMRQAVRFIEDIRTMDLDIFGVLTPKQYVHRIRELRPEQYRGIWFVPYCDGSLVCVAFGCWDMHGLESVRGFWAEFAEQYTADLGNAGDSIEDAILNARRTIDHVLEHYTLVQDESCPADVPLTENERETMEKRLETLCADDRVTFSAAREIEDLAIELKLGLRALYKEERD